MARIQENPIEERTIIASEGNALDVKERTQIETTAGQGTQVLQA